MVVGWPSSIPAVLHSGCYLVAIRAETSDPCYDISEAPILVSQGAVGLVFQSLDVLFSLPEVFVQEQLLRFDLFLGLPCPKPCFGLPVWDFLMNFLVYLVQGNIERFSVHRAILPSGHFSVARGYAGYARRLPDLLIRYSVTCLSDARVCLLKDLLYIAMYPLRSAYTL